MDRSVVIKLIAETWSADEYGVSTKQETAKTVFAKIRSATRAEFYDGGLNGLAPEFVFTMFFGDYNNEQIVEYNGARFTVYRIYQTRTDTLELHVERREGNA